MNRITNKDPNLSIVVVSYNTKKLTIDCLESVIDHTKNIIYELIVIDNASTDGSQLAIAKLVKKYKNLILIKNQKNLGFGGANNLGIKKSAANIILLLNSDVVISDNSIGEMFDWFVKQPLIGIASCMLKNQDGSVQATGGYFPTLPRVISWMTIQDLPLVDKIIKPFHPMKEKSPLKGTYFYQKEKQLDWLTGAFLMIKKKVFEDIGYFDKDYFMYTEEVDLCYRAKKTGWKIYYKPSWSIIHLGGKSSNIEASILNEFQGIKTFYKKHYPGYQYSILRLFLKIGSFIRMIVFFIIGAKKEAQVYAKAYKTA